MTSLWLSAALVVLSALAYHRVFLSPSPLANGFPSDAYRNRWALVAGASEGLGAAWAEALLSGGANVLLLANRESELRSLTERLALAHPERSVAYRFHDLADGGYGRQEEVVREILSDEGRTFALLVYNAAYGPVGTFASRPLEDAYRTIQVNVRSVLAFAHAFVGPDPDGPSPPPTGRRYDAKGIVLMSSLAGETGMGYVANYAATKSWNTAFACGLRYELRDRNVEVLACVAGPTATPSYLSLMGEDRDRRLESRPEEVVRGCLAEFGRSSAAAPGRKNRFFRFLMRSVVPTDLAVRLSSETMEPVLLARNGRQD